MHIQYIDANDIRVNRKKLRKLSSEKVRRYTLAYERGDELPPIDVNDCGGFYTVDDGRHRYAAQRAAGFTVIPVIVL